MNEQIISLPKQLFRQGEIIPVKLQYPPSDLPIQNSRIKLTGREKVEFTFQSFMGKKGFQPIWGLFLPSKHFHQETTFLDEIIATPISEKGDELVEIEIPINAIPSYYGENGKVTYLVQVQYENRDGEEKQDEVQILIDSEYQLKNLKDIVNIRSGSLTIQHTSPLIINKENCISITTQNINTPIRLILTGNETVTASSITINNPVKEVPLGQFFSEENITNMQMEFIIPSEYQQSFKGLQVRLEYAIEIQTVISQSHFGFKHEKVQTQSRIPVCVKDKK